LCFNNKQKTGTASSAEAIPVPFAFLINAAQMFADIFLPH